MTTIVFIGRKISQNRWEVLDDDIVDQVHIGHIECSEIKRPQFETREWRFKSTPISRDHYGLNSYSIHRDGTIEEGLNQTLNQLSQYAGRV